MMNFLVYGTYKFVSLLKAKTFLISLLIYFFLIGIYIYILPNIIDSSYFQLFSFKSMLISVNILLVVTSIYSALFLYKENYDNGFELILKSKPITKSTIIWTKIIIILINSILISLIQVIISCFVIFKDVDVNTYNAIMLGAFFGPLISYLFWCSITIFASLFFKKTTIFIIIIFINGFLQILSIVFSVATKNPLTKMNESGVDVSTINLLNQQNKFENKVIATHNNNPIDDQTKINDQTIQSLGYTTKNLLQKMGNEKIKSSNIIQNAYLNGIYELASFYYIYIDNFSDLKYSNKYKNDIELDISFYLSFNPNQNLNNLQTINNQVYLVNIDEIYDLKNYLNILNNNIKLPIPDYDQNSKNFKTININSLIDFNNIFFNNQQIQKAKQLQTFLGNENNLANYYLWIFSSFLATEYDVNIVNFNKKINYKQDLDNMFAGFQYMTFRLINDYINSSHNDKKQNYKEVNIETINLWFNVLNQKNFINDIDNIDLNKVNYTPNNSFKFVVINAEKLLNIINNINDYNKVELNGLIQNKKSPFNLFNKNQLQTISDAKVNSAYNQVALLPTWIITCLLIILFSTSMFYQKDVI